MGDQGLFPPAGDMPTQPTPPGGFGGEAIGEPPPATPPPVAPPPAMPDMQPPFEPEKKGGGIAGMLTSKPVIAIVALIIGAGGVYSAVRFGLVELMPTAKPPTTQFIVGQAQLKQQIEQLQNRVTGYEQAFGVSSIEQAKAEAAELAERRASQGTIDVIRQKVRDMEEKEQKYEELEAYLDEINDAITTANQDLKGTQSELTIVTARNEGLKGEVAKLESLVGKLEDANNRRVAVKEAVEESIALLAAQLKDSSPLVPPEFNKDKRIARVEALRNKLAGSNWAYPELIKEFASLFVEEIKLNSEQHHFLAKLPLEVQGQPTQRWCECLSLGTWAVYFQTLDRRLVGVFMNTAEAGRPKYEFITELTNVEKGQIRAELERMRPESFDEQVARLPGVAKQVVKQKGGLARFFDLL